MRAKSTQFVGSGRVRARCWGRGGWIWLDWVGPASARSFGAASWVGPAPAARRGQENYAAVFVAVLHLSAFCFVALMNSRTKGEWSLLTSAVANIYLFHASRLAKGVGHLRGNPPLKFLSG